MWTKISPYKIKDGISKPTHHHALLVQFPSAPLNSVGKYTMHWNNLGEKREPRRPWWLLCSLGLEILYLQHRLCSTGRESYSVHRKGTVYLFGAGLYQSQLGLAATVSFLRTLGSLDFTLQISNENYYFVFKFKVPNYLYILNIHISTAIPTYISWNFKPK